MLRADSVGPRITYYDDAAGERIELSAVTLANWAAKTGNLLRDELGAGPGSRVAILLPAHWQTAAVLFGVWWIGAEAVLDAAGPVDVALCTAQRLDEADSVVEPCGEVAVLSLDPFGRGVPDLPIGVTDYATAVGCTATRSSPNDSPARHWPADRSSRSWPTVRSLRQQGNWRPTIECCPPRRGPARKN